MISTARTAAGNVVSGAVSFLAQMPGRIASAISGAIGRVTAWGSQMLSAAKGKMAEVVSGVVSTLSSLPGKMVSIGKNIISGIISGISSMVGSLYSSIKSALGGLVDKAKSALGINSPSRVFADVVGEQIPAGIAQGVNKNARVAERAVDDMTAGLISNPGQFNGGTFDRRLTSTFSGPAVNAVSLAEVAAKIAEYGEKLLAASGQQIVLDSGVLVGETIGRIDKGLARRQALSARGV